MHRRVDQVLYLVVSPRVPVWLGPLLGTQLLEGSLQTLTELVAYEAVRLDGNALISVEGIDQARLLELGCLAPEFGDALGRKLRSAGWTRPESRLMGFTNVVECFFRDDPCPLGHGDILFVDDLIIKAVFILF